MTTTPEARKAELIAAICSEEYALKSFVDSGNRTGEATARGRLRKLWDEYAPLLPPVVVTR